MVTDELEWFNRLQRILLRDIWESYSQRMRPDVPFRFIDVIHNYKKTPEGLFLGVIFHLPAGDSAEEIAFLKEKQGSVNLSKHLFLLIGSPTGS
jgi:hypothetical protein